MTRQVLDNDIGYKGSRNNCFYFDMDGFSNFIIVVYKAEKKHVSDNPLLIQSEGFCPIGLRYIYEEFMLEFQFSDANNHAIWGTKCTHKKIEERKN